MRWNTKLITESLKTADLKKLAEEIVGLTLLEAQELKTILKTNTVLNQQQVEK